MPAIQQSQVILHTVKPCLHTIKPCFDGLEALVRRVDEVGQFLRQLQQLAREQPDPQLLQPLRVLVERADQILQGVYLRRGSHL